MVVIAFLMDACVAFLMDGCNGSSHGWLCGFSHGWLWWLFAWMVVMAFLMDCCDGNSHGYLWWYSRLLKHVSIMMVWYMQYCIIPILINYQSTHLISNLQSYISSSNLQFQCHSHTNQVQGKSGDSTSWWKSPQICCSSPQIFWIPTNLLWSLHAKIPTRGDLYRPKGARQSPPIILSTTSISKTWIKRK